jgi:hypothetical protein
MVFRHCLAKLWKMSGARAGRAIYFFARAIEWLKKTVGDRFKISAPKSKAAGQDLNPF